MRILVTALTLAFLLFSNYAEAQVSKDATVALSATVKFSPVGITLNWPNPSPSNILILRRNKGQAGNQWVQVANLANSTATTLTDETGIVMGAAYEYVIQRATSINAFGYAHVAVRAPVTDDRGKILIFVDSTTADALGVELVRMKNDMRGDGWVATPYKVGPSSTIASVKAQIQEAYNADPANVKAVLLIGNVPIPYSGNANWDGHDDHQGAWPADSYYADLNGVWTDVFVETDSNLMLPSRQATVNKPGDGKFDQSIIPSAVELQVGRIDFRRLNAPAFGEADAIGLIKRYLDKNHAWRTGAYTVDNKALVDDNFGYFGGEAFAANGYRNAYPLVGESNVVPGDFFNDSDDNSWLLGYGCGGGWYQGAGGVGSSADFATKTVNIVFANLFGSYHGDWDHESDPFMPAALASRGGILTCSWAGRPHWFNQALASGETIGFCHKETQNARFNNGFFQSLVGESGAHTALLGDPTVRAHVVAPPTNIVLTKACADVEISWSASAEAVDGYHIYRSLSNDSPYTRISSNLIAGTSFIDANPVDDTLFYQVRAIKTQSSPGGGIYFNNSVGPISYMVFEASTPPAVSIVGGSLTCAVQSLELSAQSETTTVEWAWSGPGGVNSNDTTFVVSAPGNYSLTLKDVNGCTAEANTFVDLNTISPVLNIGATIATLTCEQVSSVLSVNSASTLDETSYHWSNGATTTTVEVNLPGTYSVTVTGTANGCTGTGQFNLAQDIVAPDLELPTQVSYDCNNPCVSLSLPIQNVLDYYLDLNLVPSNEPIVLCNAGTYEVLVVSSLNGCSTSQSIEVVANVNEPGAFIGGSTLLSCQAPLIQLTGNSLASNVTYSWSGPSINASNQNQQNPSISLAGVYSLTVTDTENGCTSSDTVTIQNDSSIPVITAEGDVITCVDQFADLSCSTTSMGASFAWTGPNGFFSTEQNPGTSFPGDYTVVVTSTTGCTSSATVTVVDDTALPEFTIPTIPELNCAVTCVTVQLNPITPGLVIDPVTICDPGNYNFTVIGLNGCTATAIVTVTEAAPFVANLDPAFIDCDGTAAISAVANGGTPPYTYHWSNGSTFSSALFILDGSPISVTVSDSGGCVWESGNVNIPAPPQLLVTSNITNEVGVGAANGAIDLVLSGGTPPFIFNWSNGATTEDINGLTGGMYTVTISEVNTGCTSEASFTVTTSVGTNEAGSVQLLSVVPNPTKNTATLSVLLEGQLPLRVEVRDALGRLTQELPVVMTNELVWQIDLKQQASGVYYVNVIVDNQTFVRKLVKVE